MGYVCFLGSFILYSLLLVVPNEKKITMQKIVLTYYYEKQIWTIYNKKVGTGTDLVGTQHTSCLVVGTPVTFKALCHCFFEQRLLTYENRKGTSSNLLH